MNLSILPTGVADFDNDGDIDILTQDGGINTSVTFWENNGSGFYTDTETERITGLRTGLTLAISVAKTADFDNDGDLDIYCRVSGGTGVAPNDLYYQNSNMPPRVTSVTPASNATNVGVSP